jgi:hypothetical protein
VQTREGVEIASVQSIVTAQEPPLAGAYKSDDGASVAAPTGWRGRYHSGVSFLVVLTFVFLSLVFILAHGKVADPDLWWHLHDADYLIHHHSLPHSDMYSFTVPGYTWMNHE